MNSRDEEQIASEALAVLGTGRQIEPFSSRFAGFDLRSAYKVSRLVTEERMRRGERPVGRKIGFTNRRMWDAFGVTAPIWAPVYDKTLGPLDETVTLTGFAEPHIEPEIVFGLGASPQYGMSSQELMACIGWVAHGFEIVHSIFPRWKFTAADTVVGFGLHGALLIGPRRPVTLDRAYWLDALSHFTVELKRNGAVADTGEARNVLDGPLCALAHLVAVLENDPAQPPLTPGEIVTTGTLTLARPLAPREEWVSRVSGIDLPGARILT